MSVSAAIRRMMEAGFTLDQALLAAEVMEQEIAPVANSRTARQERNARYYASKSSEKRLKASEQDVSDDAQVSPKKETSPAPLKEKTTPSQSEPNGSSRTPRQALECVLDAEHAGSVIDHRQRIRKPLTLKAAQLLAKEFAKCPDPNAGADAMVLNGWQGFDPKWMDRQQARGSPPKASSSSALSDSAERLVQSMRSADEIRSGSRGPSIPALIPHLPVR